jgi:hypothetical protein
MMVEGPPGEVCLVLLSSDSAEIRWSKRPPRRGQRVKNQRGDVSFVTEVLPSGLNTYTVTCVGAQAFLEDLRSRSSTELVSDLLSAARRALRSHEGVAHDTVPKRPRALDRSDDWFDKYLEISFENRRLRDLERSDTIANSSPGELPRQGGEDAECGVRRA